MEFPGVKYDEIICKGGFDLSTPTLALNSGAVRDCRNFEIEPTGGYIRIGGYERFSGLPSPSDASYTIVQVASFTNTPSVGQTLSGVTSGATSVIILVSTNYMVVTKHSVGAYTDGETLKVGATVIGTKVATTVGVTSKQNAQYLNLAADNYRADIGQVPGSGPVRGVVLFNDVVYAFRNNSGNTAVDMYKSSSGGWVQVAFEYEVDFSNANTSVSDGDTLTQGGVTATIRRVVVQSGTLLSGVNTGRLIISVAAGGNFIAGAATTTGGGSITLGGAETAITMAIGGKFEFDKANFFGQLSGLRLYGCDGVNRMFEFDGTYFVPVETGTTPDTPKHIASFKSHLFCSIQSSIFNSGIGDPYNFTTTAGAAEIATGDTITGFLVQPGSQTTGTMAVFGRSNIFMLYGTSSVNWNLVNYSPGTGALDYTVQQMAQGFFLDDKGVTSLATSQAYGNFEQSALTSNIKKFIQSKHSLVTYSSINRERSQYRIFFSDGYALYSTIINGKYHGSMQVLFANPVYCACEGEMTNGTEVSFFGAATGGYVYQMEKGSSLDGEPVNEYLVFNWNSAKSPRLLKRWRRCSVEMQGDAYAEIYFGYNLAYGSTDEMQPNATSHESNFSPSIWDTSGVTWDGYFVWDGRTLSPTEVKLEGTAENIQITISSNLDYLYPYTINSMILHYTPRRSLR